MFGKRKPPGEVTIGARGFFESLAERQPWFLAIVGKGSLKGFGARWIDFHDPRADGSALATLWLIAVFFPIAPLRRAHIRVLSQTDSGVLAVAHVESMAFEQLEQLHVDASRNRSVYAFYYALILPLMLVPAFGGFALMVALNFKVSDAQFWLGALGVLAIGIGAVFLERRKMGPPKK